MSKKMVVQVNINDAASQRKAVAAISGLLGIISISSDITSRKLTVIGDLDPAAVVKKLKEKKCSPNLEEFGPVKDEKKEAEEKKKKEEEEKKKKEEEEKKRMICWETYNRPIIFEVMGENSCSW